MIDHAPASLLLIAGMGKENSKQDFSGHWMHLREAGTGSPLLAAGALGRTRPFVGQAQLPNVYLVVGLAKRALPNACSPSIRSASPRNADATCLCSLDCDAEALVLCDRNEPLRNSSSRSCAIEYIIGNGAFIFAFLLFTMPVRSLCSLLIMMASIMAYVDIVPESERLEI